MWPAFVARREGCSESRAPSLVHPLSSVLMLEEALSFAYASDIEQHGRGKPWRKEGCSLGRDDEVKALANKESVSPIYLVLRKCALCSRLC